MKTMISDALRYEGGKLFVLDQQLLPDEECWLESKSPEDMVALVKALKVRGAPLIGVAAALALGKFAEEGASRQELLAAATLLRDARPTAVNLMIAIDRLVPGLNQGDCPAPAQICAIAESIFAEDVALCEAIADHGAHLIQDGDTILTHCNTGGLATAGIGTAIGIIRRAHQQGKRIHVLVDETRPLLQGGRLTAWEMRKQNIPHTIICDNMAASLMAKGRVHKVFVGADRIATNGDFANKVGTYNVAVLCHYHNVPFYPVAPYTTIDFSCMSGQEIPIEERAADEVRGVSGSFGSVRWSPKESPVFNPAFDVTPVKLISGLVLDRGYFSREMLENGALKNL